jgi:hypothetical protein
MLFNKEINMNTKKLPKIKSEVIESTNDIFVEAEFEDTDQLWLVRNKSKVSPYYVWSCLLPLRRRMYQENG